MIPPQSQHTSWYGLYNGNISLVYSPTDWVSGYLTFNKAQYVYATANDGAVGAIGVPVIGQLRQGTKLEEAGVKFDLLGQGTLHLHRRLQPGTRGNPPARASTQES